MATKVIDDLPDDLLAIIFSKLEFRSVLTIQTVCKHWLYVSKEGFSKVTTVLVKDRHNIESLYYGQQILREPIGFNDLSNKCVIHLRRYIGGNEQTFRSMLTKIGAMFPDLKRLFIRHFYLFMEKDVILSIVQSCVLDLQSLSIICGDSNVMLSKVEAQLLSQSYPNIRVLQLESQNLIIEQSTIDELLQNLPKLEVFALNDTFCHLMANSPVYNGTVLRHMSTGITILKTTGNLFTPEVLQGMARRPYHRLRELMVHQFDIKSMALIAQHFQSIESLTIEFGPHKWCRSYNEFICLN